ESRFCRTHRQNVRGSVFENAREAAVGTRTVADEECEVFRLRKTLRNSLADEGKQVDFFVFEQFVRERDDRSELVERKLRLADNDLRALDGSSFRDPVDSYVRGERVCVVLVLRELSGEELLASCTVFRQQVTDLERKLLIDDITAVRRAGRVSRELFVRHVVK